MQAGGLSGEASLVPMTFDDKHVFIESNSNKTDHKELLCAPIRLQMHLNSQSSFDLHRTCQKAVSWVENAVSLAGYRQPTSTSWQWPWADRGYCQAI